MDPTPFPAAPEARDSRGRGIRIALVTLILLVVALTAFVGGMLTSRALADRVPIPEFGGVSAQMDELVDEVRGIIKRDALQPAGDTSLTAGALSGMLKSLDDPYAAYFDAKHFQAFQEDTEGQFFGIGINITVVEGTATVVSPLKGTPAEKAGIKAGDEIVSIDGYSNPKWTSEDVVSRIRGKEGTKVTLKIRRKGAPDLLTFTITRARIDTPNVMTEMVGSDVGYIRLLGFTARSADEMKSAIKELDRKGAKGYVLDLRDNPGGLLDSGIDIASLFISDGAIVRIEARGKAEEVRNATGDRVTTKPLVALINGNSASAAEILAGALQDHKRGILVGEKSFGKGSVQTVRDLSNGGAVKLTIAHYLTPNGRSIDRKGLEPDVVSKMDPRNQAERPKDTQFSKAVETLRAELRGR